MIGVIDCKFGETNKLLLWSIPENSECRDTSAQHARRYFTWYLDSAHIDAQHLNVVGRARGRSQGSLTQNMFLEMDIKQ
jgi:hypothetical protein